MTRPSPDELYAEMAELAHGLHWTRDDVLDLEHGERRRWLHELRRLEEPAP
ncbi:MAG TPA: DUF6760 family protein [Solirubrobacteraceae bacterium]